MNSEPALSIGGGVALVQAGLALLVTMGFDITSEQQGAIIAFSSLAVGLIASIFVRMHVYAPTTIEKMSNGAVTTAAPGNPPPGGGGVVPGPFAPAAATPTDPGAGVLGARNELVAGQPEVEGQTWFASLMAHVAELSQENGRLRERATVAMPNGRHPATNGSGSANGALTAAKAASVKAGTRHGQRRDPVARPARRLGPVKLEA